MIKELDGAQKKIFLELITNDAKVSLFSIQHQLYLDSLIAILPKEPFFWQQKAMPLFKQKKYELGMKYLDKAIELDPTDHYREYRAFIKCVFQKNYSESLEEFNYLTKINGDDGVIMDHPYSFWMGLCYLQLNEFDKAKNFIEKSIVFGQKNNFVNPYELFYLGIIEYEKENYQNAINNFNKSLEQYENFSDAKYYKALSLLNLNKKEEGQILLLEANNDFKNGFTFNEGNSLYEQFPYQVSNFMYMFATGYQKSEIP
ncbi:tetratricopeptide repeat protein [Kaistella flava (ex Peng et al. 2021)]|nr:tetratricopeptide repeat protein [Kaistella flava (ex Peng et al. 2021)]